VARINKEVSIFFVVLLVAAIAMFYVSTPGMDNVTFLVFKAPRPVFDNTIALTNLNIGETFSQDVPPLTGSHFPALRERTISTNEGSSRYRQILRFSNRRDGFVGPMIDFTEDPRGDVGDFFVFDQDDIVFEWEVRSC